MRENKNEKVHEMLDQVQLSLLEQQLLNLLLDGLNLRLDLGTLVLSHAEMGRLNIFLSSTDIFRSIPGGDDRSGLRGSRGRPTGSQGVKGRPTGSQGVKG